MSSTQTLREFLTTWGFEVNDKPLDDLDKKIEGLQQTLKIVGGAAIAAAASIFGFAKSFSTEADLIGKASERLGIGVEALQRLQYAASKSDIEAGEFEMGLNKLAKAAVDAGTGNEQLQKTFRSLGVSVKDSTGRMKNADQLFMEVSDGLSRMDNQTLKTSAAFDLFGRGGGRFIALTSKGSAGVRALGREFEELGGLVSGQGVKAAEEFHDTLESLEVVFKGIRNVVGQALLPMLTEGNNKIIEWVSANRQLIAQKIQDYLALAVEYLEDFYDTMYDVYKFVRTIVNALGGLENVIRFVGKAMLFLLSLKFASTLGSFAIAAFNVGKAMAVMGRAGLIANAKVALLPLTIGALIAALVLLADDVIGYTNGKDSVTGRLIEFFEKTFPNATKFFKGSFNFLKEVFMVPIENLKLMYDIIVSIGEWAWKKLAPAFEYIGEVIMQVWEGLKSIFSSIAAFVAKKFGEASDALFGKGDKGQENLGFFDNLRKQRKDALNAIRSSLDLAPVGEDQKKTGAGVQSKQTMQDISNNVQYRAAQIGAPIPVPGVGASANIVASAIAPVPRSASTTVSTDQSTYNLEAPITVQAAPGQSPDDIAASVQQQFQGGFEQMLRDASRSTAPIVER